MATRRARIHHAVRLMKGQGKKKDKGNVHDGRSGGNYKAVLITILGGVEGDVALYQYIRVAGVSLLNGM